MARIKGAKNIPKSLAELLLLASEQASKTGKKFSYQFTEEDGTVIEDTKTLTESELPALFELETEEDTETETYKCGKCGANLDSEVAVCPHCHAKLNW